jgi:hypothetical protein
MEDSPDEGTLESVEPRPPWSFRRRRTLIGLGLGIVAFGLGAIALPDQYGLTSLFLAALCAFLVVVATIVFLVIPGPGTLHTLFTTTPLAGAVLVVAVLLLLSTDEELRWLWILVSVAAAVWTVAAVWETRRSGS